MSVHNRGGEMQRYYLFDGSLRTSVLWFLVCLSADFCHGVEAWGTLRLRFVYDGQPPAAGWRVVDRDRSTYGDKMPDESLVVDEGRGIQNVAMWLVPRKEKPVAIHPRYAATADADVLLQCSRGRFVPHMLLLRKTQRLVLENVDMEAINPSHSSAVFAPFGIVLLRGERVELRPDTQSPDPVHFQCAIHSWMSCYVLVRDTPYVAKSDETGALVMRDVPAGKHNFVIWHERVGRVLEIPAELGTTGDNGLHLIGIPEESGESVRVPLKPKIFR